MNDSSRATNAKISSKSIPSTCAYPSPPIWVFFFLMILRCSSVLFLYTHFVLYDIYTSKSRYKLPHIISLKWLKFFLNGWNLVFIIESSFDVLRFNNWSVTHKFNHISMICLFLTMSSPSFTDFTYNCFYGLYFFNIWFFKFNFDVFLIVPCQQIVPIDLFLAPQYQIFNHLI